MTRQPAVHAPTSAPGRRALLLVPLAALVAVLPLIVHGCSCGHDIDFHLLNWMEAANQFSHGNLHPHWAYTPAFNAGEPRFVFYPPLSWVLGALLGLLLTHLPGVTEAAGWSAAPTVFTWIALTLSGLTMYRLARAFAGTNAALLAATIYLANPYMLFTAYERSAYGELLAAAWVPLLLHSILRERVSIPGIALPVALLWLTNAPAAIMGSYTLALLAVLRLGAEFVAHEPMSGSSAPGLKSGVSISRLKSSLQLALKTLAGAALGFGLAAFYIVPAAYERRFVQIAMATINGMRIDQNFLFEHTGASPDAMDHDQVLHTASLIAVILLAATVIALIAAFIRSKPRSFPTGPLAILTAGIAFLLTPLSAILWRHAPEAALLQFPWRLLAIVAPVCALAIARALKSSTASSPHPSPGAPSVAALSRWLGRNRFAASSAIALTLAAALTVPAYRSFRQLCYPEDTAPARLALFHSDAGTDPTDEYTPANADNDSLKSNNPPYWLGDSPDATPPADAQPGGVPSNLKIVAPHAEWAILNLRYYPNWYVSRQGTEGNQSADVRRRADGLIRIQVPAGISNLDIAYRRSFDEKLGDAITLLALALYLFALRVKSL